MNKHVEALKCPGCRGEKWGGFIEVHLRDVCERPAGRRVYLGRIVNVDMERGVIVISSERAGYPEEPK